MYFPYPFATAGDQTAIPETGTDGGAVSWQYGFGTSYSLNLDTDPGALPVPRLNFNYVLYEVTLTLQDLYQHGVPPWITSAANLGTSFPYAKNAITWYSDGNVYKSLAATNTTTPGTDPTKWQLGLFSPMPQTTVAGTSQTGISNMAYIPNNAALCTISLPATPADGDEFMVEGNGAGGGKITQPASTTIRLGTIVSTSGVTGYAYSTNQYDIVRLKYSATLGEWKAISIIGNPATY